MTEETKFSVMVSLFDWIQKSKYSAKKRTKFRKFLDTFCKPRDYFSAVRLILPGLDRERGSYGLKESVLATSLIDALGMSRDSPDALRLINWRKGGAKTGVNAGNFALVASEVLQRRQSMASGGLTIKELNDLLDRLASGENRSEKISILATLIKKTNAQEMKWIIMIILKDMKLGLSEKTIFHEFHPDAEDLFNVTCDLKLVCEKLKDRHQRHKRQDIEVGKAVRPQLATRISDAQAAWKKLHGKEVVMECKFDGDRIQIHKNGAEIHFFSRNFLDHSEYEHGMSNIIQQCVLADRCILDGEMLVWDSSLNRFADFGSNQEIAKAAKVGLDGHKQLCYVAFDILYVGDTSVIHQSLKERHELLRAAVKPVKGRLEILVPSGGLNNHCSPGEPCCSLVARNLDDIDKFFKQIVENRDEGIVLKDLASKWEPGDRSGKWLKLKPDYIRAGSDLDVLIIGGYYGSGRRGGEVAQFLVGLAEQPSANTYPKRFISFCRVGTGLSDDELDAVVTKLKPYFRKYDYPRKEPPSFYTVTNNSKERPDVWIESPEKSIILSITSDIRTIRSEVFAAPYGLRFPRIDRVRYDKPWHECLDVQSFVELVHSSNGTTTKATEHGGPQDGKPAPKKSSKRGEKKKVSVVPSHLIQTDVSEIKGQTLIFMNMMFYFVNLPSSHTLDSFHKMVVKNGGTFSMNMNSSVTHCIAAESRGIKYQAAKTHGDIIHYSWILDCCSEKKLIPLQPKYFLFLSESSKKKLEEEIDEFSDSYFWDLDLQSMKQILSNIDASKYDGKLVDNFKKKHSPNEKWSRFCGCCIYFYHPAQSLTPDWESLMGLTLRRLKVELLMGGGKISASLAQATHLVVLTPQGSNIDLVSLIESFTERERQRIRNKRFNVVGWQWLEQSLEKEQKLEEDAYSLKPSGLEEWSGDECLLYCDRYVVNVYFLAREPEDESHVVSDDIAMSKEDRKRGDTSSVRPPIRAMRAANSRKRGRPASEARKGKAVVRRTRARTVNKPVKIYETKSDESSSDEVEGNVMMLSEGIKGRAEEAGKEKADVKEEGFNIEGDKLGMDELGSKSEPSNLEIHGDSMDDPVNAMLMDMIPSLGMKVLDNKEDQNRMEKHQTDPNLKMKMIENKEDQNQTDPALGMKMIENKEDENRTEKPIIQPPPPRPPPVQRKKVSYRELAEELLKE
ncbi:DNA ligase 4 [Linum perenne]